MYHQIFNPYYPAQWVTMGSRSLSTSDSYTTYNYVVSPNYIDASNNIYVRNKVICNSHTYALFTDRAEYKSYTDQYIIDVNYVADDVQPLFNFDTGLFNNARDFNLFFQGYTDQGTADLWVQQGSTWTRMLGNIGTSLYTVANVGIYDVNVIYLDLGPVTDVKSINIDYLYLYSKDSGTIHQADLSKTISSAFLNRYDGLGNYQKKYDVTAEFDYRFTEANSQLSSYTDVDVSIDGTWIPLVADGIWHYDYSYNFEFDSASASGLD